MKVAWGPPFGISTASGPCIGDILFLWDSFCSSRQLLFPWQQANQEMEGSGVVGMRFSAPSTVEAALKGRDSIFSTVVQP
jgi:hypothetical protein